MRFYPGLHQPSDARHFEYCFIAYPRLVRRRRSFRVWRWILDCGGFTEVERHGRYLLPLETYARDADRWSWCGELQRVVARDWMCAPPILTRTGLSIAEHQRLTVDALDALRGLVRFVEVMPVIQGWAPDDYAAHVRQYGERLEPGCWVGVGSIAARQDDTALVEAILRTILAERPDLRLHGLGLKTCSLAVPAIYQMLYSADSMAWSMAARYEGRDANDWREARAFADRIAQLHAA